MGQPKPTTPQVYAAVGVAAGTAAGAVLTALGDGTASIAGLAVLVAATVVVGTLILTSGQQRQRQQIADLARELGTARDDMAALAAAQTRLMELIADGGTVRAQRTPTALHRFN